MDVTFYPRSNEEYFLLDSSIIIEDSIDEYLVDPNLSVSDMIEQYDINIICGKEKKPKKELRCAVCSAKAYGYNFDQISCESCKAFFRRNALKDKNELHCRFSGTCNITLESRRHCSYCRINKCFAVGMRKEWIRSEENKKKQRNQLNKNQRRRFSRQLAETPILMQPGYSINSPILSSLDRTRLNNITHCYEQFTREPSLSILSVPPKSLRLRIDEFYNRKKPIFVNLITYFKHLPELQTLCVEDQIALIKRNIRFIIPLNYAILKIARKKSSPLRIQTIGCVDNVDLHSLYHTLSDLFVEVVICDPIIIQLFLIILFFTTNSITISSIHDSTQLEQSSHIQEIQSSYMNLLWLYLIEKCGEIKAIHLFTKMITKYLHVQMKIEQIDSIIRMNNDIERIDLLMQTVLHLT